MSVYIFDLDGTIADSNGAWDDIDRQLIAEYGAYVPENIIASMAALGYDELYEVLKSYGICFEGVDVMREHIDALAEYEYRNNISLKDGAEEYIKKVSETDRTVLFTASPERLYKPFLVRCGLYGMFDDLICSDDICVDKKEPAAFTKAADILGVVPSECIVLEDSPLNALSAHKAGMRVIGVYDRFSAELPGYDRIKEISDRYIYSFNELMGE